MNKPTAKPTFAEFIRDRRMQLSLNQRQVALNVGFKSIAHLSETPKLSQAWNRERVSL